MTRYSHSNCKVSRSRTAAITAAAGWPSRRVLLSTLYLRSTRTHTCWSVFLIPRPGELVSITTTGILYSRFILAMVSPMTKRLVRRWRRPENRFRTSPLTHTQPGTNGATMSSIEMGMR